MNRFAIDVLEAASERAGPAPIKPHTADRLALAWLALNKVAEPWQIEQFWKGLTSQRSVESMDEYCRLRDMAICIRRWKVVAFGRE